MTASIFGPRFSLLGQVLRTIIARLDFLPIHHVALQVRLRVVQAVALRELAFGLAAALVEVPVLGTHVHMTEDA